MGTVSQGPITTRSAADSMSHYVGFRSSKHFSDLFQNERRTGILGVSENRSVNYQ